MIDSVTPKSIKDWIASLPPKTEEEKAAIRAENAKFNMMSVGEAMQAAYDDPAKSMGKEGWVYRDIPRMSECTWDNLLGWIGEDNYEILAYTSGDCITSKDPVTGEYKSIPIDPWIRGQILISPAGIENLKNKRSDNV